MPENKQIQEEMTQIQAELQEALQTLMSEVGSKLKPKEKEEIKKEVDDLNNLLDRLKSGMVWISLFGKATVGKSSLVNSIIGEDLAEVDIKNGSTTTCFGFHKEPWVIVDVPGFMDDPNLEYIAIEEAKKAHGHIFVIDGEPLGEEIKLFDAVHNHCPDTPKLVFVNKYNVLEHRCTSEELEKVKSLISQKMGKYVQSPNDIIFGNARLKINDKMVRQDVPQLIDRLYNGAGTLGAIMNVLDPAGRAENVSSQMREKISEIRMGIGRRVAGIFGALEVGAAMIPFNTLITTPSLLTSLAFTEMKIMGKKITKTDSIKIALEGLKTCGTVLIGDFVAVTIVGAIIDLANILGPIGTLAAALANTAGLGYWRYKRTIIFGEVMLEFAKRDFSWGGEDKHKIIKDCKNRAMAYHMKFKKSHEII